MTYYHGFFKVITSNLILLTNVDIPVIKLDSVQNKKRLPNIIRWCLEDAFFTLIVLFGLFLWLLARFGILFRYYGLLG